jgi:bacterioferritin-associated ferredoxin
MNGIKCPICHEVGQAVSAMTIESMMLNPKRLVYQATYFICKNPDCKIAYYNDKGHDQMMVSELNTPIHFKHHASPKWICYCSRVTEDEIIDAIQNKGCHTVEDIIDDTQAYTVKKCVINNPTGKNCLSDMQQLINNYRNNR